MPTTLPTLTETFDNAFTHTWYEIRPEAIDNILEATVFTMALKEYGRCPAEVLHYKQRRHQGMLDLQLDVKTGKNTEANDDYEIKA